MPESGSFTPPSISQLRLKSTVPNNGAASPQILHGITAAEIGVRIIMRQLFGTMAAGQGNHRHSGTARKGRTRNDGRASLVCCKCPLLTQSGSVG